MGQGFTQRVNAPFSGINRRLVFKTRSFNTGGPVDIDLDSTSTISFGFAFAQMKAKVQRKKKFLWHTYWGTSNGDQLELRIDNMKLETDFVANPNPMPTAARPTFVGVVSDYKIGNHILNAMNFRFASFSFGFVSVQDIYNFLNNLLNEKIAAGYYDVWKGIETHILQHLDPGLPGRYPKYARNFDTWNEDARLRWVLSQGEVSRCYEHRVTWRLGSNGHVKYTRNGGVAGPQDLPQPTAFFKYKMKAGSFVARARVGASWAVARIVRL